jgi:hypothetical protein
MKKLIKNILTFIKDEHKQTIETELTRVMTNYKKFTRKEREEMIEVGGTMDYFYSNFHTNLYNVLIDKEDYEDVLDSIRSFFEV